MPRSSGGGSVPRHAPRLNASARQPAGFAALFVAPRRRTSSDGASMPLTAIVAALPSSATAGCSTMSSPEPGSGMLADAAAGARTTHSANAAARRFIVRVQRTRSRRRCARDWYLPVADQCDPRRLVLVAFAGLGQHERVGAVGVRDERRSFALRLRESLIPDDVV